MFNQVFDKNLPVWLVEERADDWLVADKKVIGVKLFSGTKQRMARLHQCPLFHLSGNNLQCDVLPMEEKGAYIWQHCIVPESNLLPKRDATLNRTRKYQYRQ